MAVTLATLRTNAKSRADMLVSSSSSAFVSDPEWNVFISAAYSDLYDFLVGVYEDYFLQQATIATVGGTERYSLAAITPAVYKLRGVDLLISNAPGNYLPLHRFEWADRARFVSSFSTGALLSNGQGMRYCLQAGSLVFAPIPDAIYQVRLSYIPQSVALVNDGDMIDAVIPSGFEDYIVLSAAIRALKKEESDTTALEGELAQMKARIESMAPGRDALEPMRMTGRSDLWSLDPLVRRLWY